MKKKPYGDKQVTKCGNCEQPLCSKHAVPQMSAGHKTFLCPECAKAWKQSEKTVGTLPPTPAAALKKPAEQPKAPAPAPKPAAQAPAKPAAAAPKPAAAAPKPAPVQLAPLQQKKNEPPAEDSGPLEF